MEPRRWRRGIFQISVLLSLSRTVWAGLVLLEIFELLPVIARQLRTFPRLMLGKATTAILALASTVGLIFAALTFNSANIAFLLDPTFGGRNRVFNYFTTAGFLPSQPIDGFQEVVYASVTRILGYSGLVSFILLMFSPLFLVLAGHIRAQRPVPHGRAQRPHPLPRCWPPSTVVSTTFPP